MYILSIDPGWTTGICIAKVDADEFEVIEAGEAALREAKFRKTGLIIATAFIFLLAMALYLKIRQIDKKTPA